MAGSKILTNFLKRALGSNKEQPKPQLLMRYPHQIAPLVGKLEQGYLLRTYQEGDESGWMEALNANGELGVWDLQRIRAELEGDLVQGTQFFVVVGGEIGALGSVYDRTIGGVKSWEIGWVASHPGHRGKGLGSHVTARTIESALALPRRPIVLRTDDFRIPAIKTYLKLGFVPTYDHASYAARWQEVFAELGEQYAVFNPAKK